MMRSVEFYKTSSGREPVKDFLIELKKSNPAGWHKIILYITLLKDGGTEFDLPYVKKIQGDIWELRPTPWRILFYTGAGGIYVMLSIFRKTSQKTPSREIKLAHTRMADYKKRFKI